MHPHTNTTRTPSTGRRKNYGRNSSDEQHERATIVSQVHYVDDWDRAHGGDPSPDQWYKDEGWSGFTLARPDLDRLRRDAARKDRDWDELLIYDTSRFSREPIHRIGILEPEMKAHGIKIIYIASPIFEDTPDGRFMAWQDAGMQRWFAEKSKDNMWRGLTDDVRHGKCWWAPYGYEVIRVNPDGRGRKEFIVKPKEPQASIVQEMFNLVLNNFTCYAIADLLNMRGIPSARGGKWSQRAVYDIITNRYYSGEARWGRYQWVEPKSRREGSPEYRRRTKTKERSCAG